MASQNKNLEVLCECCKKPFSNSTLLRHIGQREACKEFYGPRFKDMKKEKGRKKVFRHRKKNQVESAKQWKKRKESYANSPDLKEKKRQYYQEHKERIKHR